MATVITSPSHLELGKAQRRVLALKMRLSTLQGQAKELQSRKLKLSASISLAKARIELAPQAAEVFTYLQEKAHGRAVGEFEDLLTAFVHDVLPDAGDIRLELGTERGAPSLDILLDNGGDMENILEGNGGGLTNIVVTSLGFSALSRTSNRHLMVLDEPDCWLKAKYVPSFTKVIAEVANPALQPDGSMSTGCQTLLISHNDIGLMDEGAHIQDLRNERDLKAFADRLGVPITYHGEVGKCAHVVWAPAGASGSGSIQVRYREDSLGDEEQNALTKGFPYVEAIGGARAWDPDQPGIRWIEVENLRRHIKTRLELSPGLNVLTGDINGGKSTMYFTALRAIAYGEMDDSMIRHGTDRAVVRVGLEDNVVLEVARSRKGSPKILFSLFRDGKLERESRPETKNSVPSFIAEALCIERVDGMDIQLRSQKQPVFLLNETPARRAQLLSVGREAGLLQDLIESHRRELRRDKDLVRREEAELNEVTRTLTVLAPLAALAGLAEIISGLGDEAKASQESLTHACGLAAKLAPVERRAQLAVCLGSQLAESPESPACVDTTDLQQLVATLARNELFARVPDLPAAPKSVSPAELGDTKKLARDIDRIAQSYQISQLSRIGIDAPPVVDIISTALLRQYGVSLSEKLAKIDLLGKEVAAVVTEESQAKQSFEDFKKEIGVCPVCDQAFEGHSHD